MQKAIVAREPGLLAASEAVTDVECSAMNSRVAVPCASLEAIRGGHLPPLELL